MNTTWFKFPTSFFAEARTIKLRREIGEAAYWVPVRLWAFAASQDGSGNLSAYQPVELAEALHYQGDAEKLLKALKPDFLDRRGRVVGWTELFALAASRKLSSQKAAAARWAPKPTSETGDQRKEEEKRESERRGDRDALRDALRDASEPTLTHSSASLFSIPDPIRLEVQTEHRLTPEGVSDAVRRYVEDKTPYIGKDGPLSPEGFKGWLRTSAAGKQIVKRLRPTRSPLGDPLTREDGPAGWRQWARANLVDPTHADRPWSSFDQTERTHITASMRNAKASPAPVENIEDRATF